MEYLMKKAIKKVSLVGLGALGVLYADHIAKHIPFDDLRIVADKSRIQKYENEGVYCNGNLCHFNYVLPEDVVEPADLLIFSVKYTHLQEAIVAVKNHVGENTIIISVLNGIESEKDIAKAYGQQHLLYCVAQGMTASKIGNQMTYKHKGLLCFGELNETTNSDQVERLKNFFDAISMPYEINNHMNIKLWSKLMVNVGINQTVAYYQTNNQAIQKEGPERSMMIAAMEEVLLVADKEGIGILREDLNYWLKIIDGLSPEGSPSMAQDVKAKRYSEVDLFAGTIVRLAEKYDLKVPINEAFYNYFIKLEDGY